MYSLEKGPFNASLKNVMCYYCLEKLYLNTCFKQENAYSRTDLERQLGRYILLFSGSARLISFEIRLITKELRQNLNV